MTVHFPLDHRCTKRMVKAETDFLMWAKMAGVDADILDHAFLTIMRNRIDNGMWLDRRFTENKKQFLLECYAHGTMQVLRQNPDAWGTLRDPFDALVEARPSMAPFQFVARLVAEGRLSR